MSLLDHHSTLFFQQLHPSLSLSYLPFRSDLAAPKPPMARFVTSLRSAMTTHVFRIAVLFRILLLFSRLEMQSSHFLVGLIRSPFPGTPSAASQPQPHLVRFPRQGLERRKSALYRNPN